MITRHLTDCVSAAATDPNANGQKLPLIFAAGRVGCNHPWRARHSLTEETDRPRVARSRTSGKIIARSAKSKTVNTLVRARKRQARAAIWSPFLRDFGTGSKAGSKLLTPIRTLRSWVGRGWPGESLYVRSIRMSRQRRSPRNAKGTPRKIKPLEELKIVHPHAAGLDIGAEEIWASVPVSSTAEPVRVFGPFTADLHALADWLIACGVDTVAMESTGVYWIPIFEILEARGLKVFLVNSWHLKHVPGRKSDVLDCQWIQQLHSLGLLRGSFRPDAEMCALRSLLRHRAMLIEHRSPHILHLQKAGSVPVTGTSPI